MPALDSLRQPAPSTDSRADAWMNSAGTRRLLRGCLRAAAADVARSSGRYGLFVYPQMPIDEAFQSANLHTALHLHRSGGEFAGDLRCVESSLPFADDSFALILLGCAFELARDPVGLAAECARLLEPEGTLLVLGLNPWSPAHLRWLFRGLRSWSPEALRPLLTGLGLEIVRYRYLGGLWSSGDADTIDAADADIAATLPLRCGFLIEARRRDPGLTPLRTTRQRMVLGSGAHAG